MARRAVIETRIETIIRETLGVSLSGPASS